MLLFFSHDWLIFETVPQKLLVALNLELEVLVPNSKTIPNT